MPALAFDEYSYRTTLDGTWYQSDGAFLPSVSSTLALSMEAHSGSIFAASSSFSYARGRDSEPWSESFGVALSTKPARTWFGDLVSLAIGHREPREASAEEETDWVSAWFDSVLAQPPALRETFAVDATVGRKADAVTSAIITFDYQSKAIAAESLTVGVGAKVEHTLELGAESVVWGLGYELSVMAKVVF
ncbi:MAG: hypothetical protein JXM71_03920 [Spirochaetales bacterium]|nr:hypothetical protein [Spirochaetales bacterium]